MSNSEQFEPGAVPWPVLQPLGPRRLSMPIRIRRPVCVIGSHSRVHLPLPSDQVSRSHALLIVDGITAYVRDLSSRNGIFVNGALACEAKLRHGDVLTVKPWSFRWIAPPPPGHRPRKFAPATSPGLFTLNLIGQLSPHPIAGNTALIGRRAGCDIVIGHEMVSPAHAIIFRRGAAHYLRDLNSRTGTFVNGRRVREAELRTGAEIRIGLSFIYFEAADPQASKGNGFDLDRIVGPPAADGLTGLSGLSNSDAPHRRVHTPQAAPTIEELLGAEPVHLEIPTLRSRPEDAILKVNDREEAPFAAALK